MFGLIYQFDVLLSRWTSEAWQVAKESLPDELEEKELLALESGCRTGLRHQLFIDLETETHAFAVEGAASDNFSAIAIGQAIETLEHAAGLVDSSNRIERVRKITNERPFFIVATTLREELRGLGQALALEGGPLDLGFLVGSATTKLLPQIVGTGRAKELLFTGDFIDADAAYRIGLVNRVYAPDELMPAAQQLGAKLARGPAAAQQLIKHMVRKLHTNNYEEHWQLIDKAGAYVRETQDYDEGMRSFMEKRPPEFKGF